MSETQNRIGQDFTLLEIIRFGLPSFAMNIFTNIFKSLDDGLFVSRYVGELALASINLLAPLRCVILAIQHLFSLGSSNISAKLMGENKQHKAKEVFSKAVISACVVGIIFAIILNVFAYPILNFLGGDMTTNVYAIYQFRIVYSIAPITLINQIFTCYYATAGKPKMGMICSVVNGAFNIGLDILLVAILKWGIIGASIATAAGDVAVFILGLVFYNNKHNEIYFVKVHEGFVETSLQSSKYALPQCLNSFSFGVTALLSNKVILDLIGSSGIATNAIVGDIRSIIASGLIGFASCVGPIIAFNYGSNNYMRLKRIIKYIVQIWFFGSLILTSLGFILKTPLISLFMSENSSTSFLELTSQALSIELLSIPFACGCIFMSRGFIALSLPKQATVLSLFRNLFIKAIVYLTIPYIIANIGIWIAHPLAECLSFMFGLYIVYLNKDTITGNRV